MEQHSQRVCVAVTNTHTHTRALVGSRKQEAKALPVSDLLPADPARLLLRDDALHLLVEDPLLLDLEPVKHQDQIFWEKKTQQKNNNNPSSSDADFKMKSTKQQQNTGLDEDERNMVVSFQKMFLILSFLFPFLVFGTFLQELFYMLQLQRNKPHVKTQAEKKKKKQYKKPSC